MKRILLSLVAAVAVIASASAQESGFTFGPKAGITISNISNSDNENKLGFTGGLFGQYRFCNLFALSLDVLYARQGNKYDGNKFKLDYLNLPVLANFYVWNGLAVKAGIQPGIRLSAKDNGVDVKDNVKGADFSIPVGLSYDFACGLVLDARYNIGTGNMIKNAPIDVDNTSAHNNSFAITAGWRF